MCFLYSLLLSRFLSFVFCNLNIFVNMLFFKKLFFLVLSEHHKSIVMIFIIFAKT
jgi:hypothetical protein